MFPGALLASVQCHLSPAASTPSRQVWPCAGKIGISNKAWQAVRACSLWGLWVPKPNPSSPALQSQILFSRLPKQNLHLGDREWHHSGGQVCRVPCVDRISSSVALAGSVWYQCCALSVVEGPRHPGFPHSCEGPEHLTPSASFKNIESIVTKVRSFNFKLYGAGAGLMGQGNYQVISEKS